ncbi:protein EFR3 homolog B isoform X1 [Micropterus salmoides]|uniref:protein EFR3 homolog B isoform X1 n=2 Tax=Micropterus salmoides TaxID=27706 RepID=UPI0018EC0544|nr:protein EFR3 homolog B isoform X1 [Micropterus salmoides]XP_038582625.1 protein EFR3 homolog B isoform X1 [Micropterus salmoides]XP_038582626.1 protein EFR3 homolog B isoform X1 [Micropterus salmoides]XP_045916060.1 protein EFR3 homolog B isoform X4 [Micropterus dolomieu]
MPLPAPDVPASQRLALDCRTLLDHRIGKGVCGCCGALRPRYKRLVDNIFPEDPEDGLVKANMEKLTFYALSAPEKLDRIGAYLSERLSRDVARHRYGYVCIAMEALDQLLMACHCQSINLFVESFLKMVRKLLESDKPNLQILGTNSFVKFANIEEDTPSYHRSYDFFVSRFSEMCHSSYEDPDIRTKIRMAGIKGLQGVVRKTVNDELQANIWDPQHMDKIVPSLLFNLQSGERTESRSPSPLQASEKEKESPVELTERCFRELLGRAAYGNIKNAVTPVLMHLDNHSLWEGKTFAVRCFKIIMYSIQSQHSHLVIQQLLGHLDANSKNSATVRAGIVEVLLEAAAIAASGSVGPTVLEVFNTLLRQLRLSVDYELTGSYDGSTNIGTKIIKAHEERQLQEAVIRTIGSFANTLPTYQRSEVMLFIMGKIPVPGVHPALPSTGSGPEGTRMIQVMLLKSLVQVTAGFQTTNMLTALPSSFLEPLLSFSLTEDPEVRLLVLQILLSLIDRHENTPKFSNISIISDISVLKLKVDKCSRQDNLFMKKHSQQLYRHIYLGCKEQSSGRQHYETLFALLGLLSVELANEEVVVDLIRLALALQDLALSTDEALPVYNRCAVHALAAAYLNLICQLTTVPAFCQHIHEVIEVRQKESPHLLPEDVFIDNPKLPSSLEKVEGNVLFLQSKITEVLGGSGYNTERLATPYVPQYTDEDRLSKRKSIGETISLQVEVESRNSPEKEERTPAEEITFETLKNAIVDSVGMEEQERERRRQVVEKFQKAPFEEIAAHCGARATLLQSKLNQIFEITIRPPPSPSGTISSGYGQSQSRSVPIYEMKFPDLCVY